MRQPPREFPHFLEYRVTVLILVAAVVLTLRWHTGTDFEFLMLRYEAWPQEPWRLLTSCLLHANAIHLAFNLYWTWRFGAVLEHLMGLAPMVGLYLFLGAGSSAAEWALGGGGVGLSGIGYGLFGLTWALDRYHPTYRGLIDPRITRLFVVWFFLCIAATYLNLLPVANYAHGMGAVLGGLIGMALSPFAKRKRPARLALAALVPLLALACTVARPYVNLSPVQLFNDGTAAIEGGDYEMAIHLLHRATFLDSDLVPAWHNLAYAYNKLERPVEAARAWEEKLRAEREESRARTNAESAGESLFELPGSLRGDG